MLVKSRFLNHNVYFRHNNPEIATSEVIDPQICYEKMGGQFQNLVVAGYMTSEDKEIFYKQKQEEIDKFKSKSNKKPQSLLHLTTEDIQYFLQAYLLEMEQVHGGDEMPAHFYSRLQQLRTKKFTTSISNSSRNNYKRAFENVVYVFGLPPEIVNVSVVNVQEDAEKEVTRVVLPAPKQANPTYTMNTSEYGDLMDTVNTLLNVVEDLKEEVKASRAESLELANTVVEQSKIITMLCTVLPSVRVAKTNVVVDVDMLANLLLQKGVGCNREIWIVGDETVNRAKDLREFVLDNAKYALEDIVLANPTAGKIRISNPTELIARQVKQLETSGVPTGIEIIDKPNQTLIN